MGDDGYVIPHDEHLQKLFMRKPGLPILKVRFPDGSDRPYWNTFYQEVSYPELSATDLAGLAGLSPEQASSIVAVVNDAIQTQARHPEHRSRRTLELQGQRRIDCGTPAEIPRTDGPESEVRSGVGVYDDTLKKLRDFGARLVRLDAFAYLHKEPGMTNFFNKPGTWDYLERLRDIATQYELILLPEIHSEYGLGLHDEVAASGFRSMTFSFRAS